MARTVFVHVGLPKTGTTYLQTLLWDNWEELRRQGVLLPGVSARQHLWASGVVREDPRLDRRGPDAQHAWDQLVRQINAWPGTAVVSHEFFAGASAAQATRAVSVLDGAEAHVVATARDTLSLVTARWQEFVKNGSTVPIDGYPVREETDPVDEWDWGTLDLADVLGRWGAAVPAERVHVLTLPRPDEPRETLWLRFATLLGIDPGSCRTGGSAENESLGVVEVELLRRVNAELRGFRSAQDRGNWIRGYLAQGKLVPRGGERFWPSDERVAELCARGNRIADEVAAAGYDVIGDVEDLRPPAVVPPRRHPSSVTDGELAAAGAEVIAAMLTDVRRLTREKRALEERSAVLRPVAVAPTVVRRVLGAARRAADRARFVSGRG
ncbi:MAG TPA: hypothetical protein VER39_16860 [Nocardioidaceae bacterium]|nr:hypothetical protein [Nocardioidaceae bacterium]